MAATRIKAVLFALCAISLFLCPVCARGNGSGNTRERIDELYSKSKKKFPEVPDISAEELIRRIDEEKIVLVDAREQAERDVSVIRGSLSVKEFESAIETFTGVPVVVYCTIGDRSGRYTRRLRERGTDAHNLGGGILAWIRAGGAVADEQGNETRRVHVYGSKWNLLPEGCTAVW
jgi:rhodanese-related sulfurtransferase